MVFLQLVKVTKINSPNSSESRLENINNQASPRLPNRYYYNNLNKLVEQKNGGSAPTILKRDNTTVKKHSPQEYIQSARFSICSVYRPK